MDRRERANDPVEATRAALEGKQAEMWTALPGIVESFDPVAMTVCVQPSIKGQIQDESGNSSSVDLPLLTDVPVVFPGGGGFTLTYPIKKGDEALVIFASRCIDAWWQSGGIGGTPDERMHDLSDGIAIVGPRSQPRKLDPAVDADNVQLRSDDGKSHITMMPDYTIKAENPLASCELGSNGMISFSGSGIRMTNKDCGATEATVSGTFTTDELVSGNVNFNTHYHICQDGGRTSEPRS